MKILTFLHSFEPGGVERVALRLAKSWNDLGHDAPVFMGRPDGAARTSAPENINYIFPIAPRVSPASFETLWMIFLLPQVIRREKPDALFCAGNSYTVVSVAIKLLLGRSCPPILAKISNDLYRHDLPASSRWFYHFWLRLQTRFLDRLVGMAEPMREEITQCMAAPSSKIAIIRDPAIERSVIDRAAKLRRANVSQRCGRRFVAVGRLVSQKNFSALLKALQSSALTGDRLTIVGDGPLRDKLERQTTDLGICAKVKFAGHSDDVIADLVRSDVFVLSSLYEGVPAVLVEALAVGLGIIATDCSSSIAEMLGNGKFGKIIPVGNVAALSSAIRDASPITNDTNARRAMADNFTLEKASSLYLLQFQIIVRNFRTASARIIAQGYCK